MQEATRERLDTLIEMKGGKRLSETGDSVDEKIDVECQNGHIWRVKPASLLYSKSWCKQCKVDERRRGKEEIEEMARERGGECLSASYTNVQTQIRWRCAQGHEFALATRSVLQGSWCPECRRNGKKTPYRQAFKGVVAMVEGKGGAHIGSATKITEKTRWRCAQGHEFEATGRMLETRRHLCPECAGVKRTTLASIRKECERRGGLCLSDQYRGLNEPLEFQCQEGHRWTAKWRNVGLNGSWCPFCARKRKNYEPLHRLASKHRGSLISETPVSQDFGYRWKCEKGHKFTATFTAAKAGWCPVCAFDRAKRQPDPEVFEKIAARNGGQCINPSRLEWRCDRGHRFKASLASAAIAWCPSCVEESGKEARQQSKVESIRDQP